MTAADFAALVEARRTGAGKWQARCPAHDDRSPSLSIRAGQDGRVLVHCFAGCVLEGILSALNLTRGDLFAGPPPTPEHAAALRAACEERERQAQAEHQARGETWRKVRRWEAVVSALGTKLARLPDDAPDADTLTRLYHQASDSLHVAEIEAERVSKP